MIATALEEVSNWEALADWLDINSDTIRTNCAPSLDLSQCYRRELVEILCDRLPSGDPYLVTEHIYSRCVGNSHEQEETSSSIARFEFLQ